MRRELLLSALVVWAALLLWVAAVPEREAEATTDDVAHGSVEHRAAGARDPTAALAASSAEGAPRDEGLALGATPEAAPDAEDTGPWTGTGRTARASVALESDSGRHPHAASSDGQALEAPCCAAERAATEVPVAILSGRVTSQTGVPRVAWSVSARATGDLAFESVTDADGEYSIAVRAGAVYEVEVLRPLSHPALPRHRRAGVEADASGVDFELPELGSLRLRFVDAETGAAVASFGAGSVGLVWKPSEARGFETCAARPSASGLVELPLDADSVVDVGLCASAAGYRATTLTRIAVESAEHALPIEVELHRGLEIRVSLSAADGSRREPESRVYLLRDDEHAFVDPARARFPASPTEWPELDDPRLAARTLRGETWLRGLVPGTYVALPLPDDLAFQPARVVLTEADDGASLELRWRAR